MPPLPRRLFIDVETIGAMAKNRRGSLEPNAHSQLLYVGLPGKRAYSYLYTRQLLGSTRVLTYDTVQRFNRGAKGERAIKAAKEEFEYRLKTITPYSNLAHPGLVTVQLLATTFFTTPQSVVDWCQRELVPYTVVDDTIYFDPAKLLDHFEWSL